MAEDSTRPTPHGEDATDVLLRCGHRQWVMSVVRVNDVALCERCNLHRSVGEVFAFVATPGRQADGYSNRAIASPPQDPEGPHTWGHASDPPRPGRSDR